MPRTPDMYQPGLAWEETLFSGDVPVWTKEPSIDIIETLASQHLGCTCSIAYFAHGAFNKIYSVECSRGSFIFRVWSPICPTVKTFSEITTISFIRANTSIPVPEIIAYNADLNYKLEFEWIIMERVNDRSLGERWHEMSWLKKHLLVRQLTNYISQLSPLELSGIRSLCEYQLNSYTVGSTSAVEHVVGETSTPGFFRRDHIQLDVHHGPYQTSAEYVSAHTHFLLQNIAHPTTKTSEVKLNKYKSSTIDSSALYPKCSPTQASSKQPSTTTTSVAKTS